MSPALPLLRVRVGIVVERRKTDSPWVDFIWRGVAVLPDEPKMEPWTLLREQEEATLFYAGSAAVDLYPSETARYRENLTSGNPSIWVILSPSDGPWPYAVAATTADPAEGESFTEAGANLVEAVPMPEAIRELIENFVAEHHVEREFVKRKQRRVDTEALARRHHEGGHDE
ncbi:MAG TPA: DUF3305 domain-containing protein [Bradyrhizobium sp.]|jgi:uncharacterized protein DUF3305|nr:DUF3305 domain-containing protein [Bradyrhizobium sp.]